MLQCRSAVVNTTLCIHSLSFLTNLRSQFGLRPLFIQHNIPHAGGELGRQRSAFLLTLPAQMSQEILLNIVKHLAEDRSQKERNRDSRAGLPLEYDDLLPPSMGGDWPDRSTSYMAQHWRMPWRSLWRLLGPVRLAHHSFLGPIDQIFWIEFEIIYPRDIVFLSWAGHDRIPSMQ